MQNIRERLGAAVRKLRKERGYSQESFAIKAKLGRSYMGQIERGEINISIDNIEKIARGLEMSVGELMMVAAP